MGHSRGDRWPEVREHLASLGAWPELWPYSLVRREWRREPESWLSVDASTVAVLKAEAQEGLWGSVYRPL